MALTHRSPARQPAPAARARHVLVDAARHSAGHATAVLVFSAASAAATLALPAALGIALDRTLNGAAGLHRAVVLCALLILTEVLSDALVAYLSGVTSARSTARIRRRGIEHLLSLEPRRAADQFTVGDLVTRLTGNAAEAGTAPVTAAAGAASLLAPLGGLAALALTDLWLAAAFLAGAPLLLVLLRAFTRHSSDSITQYQRIQATIASRLVEALGGARTIAAAGTAKRERARILAPLEALSAQGRRMWQVYGHAAAGSSILVPLLITLVVAVGGIRLVDGNLSVGRLLAAAAYTNLAAGLGAVTGQLNALLRSRSAARRTAEVLSIPPVRQGRRPLPEGGPGRLELRGVTVIRNGAPVLHDVDLTVPGGTTMAIVGRSGAGKSTLAALAGRLTDPDAGQVLLDGVPLTEVDPAHLRRETGYAFERPVLFGETVGAAIAFGPDAPSARHIEKAARAAGADTFVQLLPGRYGARLLQVPLSGGELQRLGLARAFAHAGRLLVLDDATSSLDSVTELHVGRALLRDVHPGTRLLIAHRVSTAARADLVAWMENGRIRAVGPHERLWEYAGYRAVFAGPEDSATRDPDS
ncbi:ABC transporter ATP-binding protein [Streptomyces sp. NPDC002668]|uniref:ABC transporter ATP-binding protein n=1 Tax=Streptomyces sp. NPDC002668 TaxID=3154422 RepID=UPI00332EAF10